MNFQQYPVTKVVVIEGIEMVVPINTTHVSRDMNGCVAAWTDRPTIWDGYYSHKTLRPVIIGETKDLSIDCWVL